MTPLEYYIMTQVARQAARRNYLQDQYRLINMARMTSMLLPRTKTSRLFDRNVNLFEAYVNYRANTDF
jgi:hypothetical protein